MIILILFVAAIIVLQLLLFFRTGALIKKLRRVLSGTFHTGEMPDEEVTVIIYDSEDKDALSLNIETSINTYLRKNKGAVSDFNLIKDIVERNCDTLEDEIAAQTPLPLYLGLMGTVAGIILGLFTIDDFTKIDTMVSTLMSDVAVAMVASFMGIGCTTLTLWRSKQCKARVEANKNIFYTWIQTNLLPVLTQSAVSAITLLQRNLTHFNESFGRTADRLEEKLEGLGETYEWQIEILNKIQSIDINKMATANVKILSALNNSTGNLHAFAKYMEEVTEYLEAVRELNHKLDLQLERTNTLHVVAEFYTKQMSEIGLRQDAIRSAVVSVDDVMKSALADLQANSEQGLRSMQEAYVNQIMTMQDTVTKHTEAIARQLGSIPKVMEQMENVARIPAALDKIAGRIEESNGALIKNMNRLMSGSSDQKAIASQSGVAHGQATHDRSSNSIKWGILASLIVIAIACIANLYVNVWGTPAWLGLNDKDSVMAPGHMDNMESTVGDEKAAVEEFIAVEAVEDTLPAVNDTDTEKRQASERNRTPKPRPAQAQRPAQVSRPTAEPSAPTATPENTTQSGSNRNSITNRHR